MHLKIYLGSSAALVGSANFTVQGIEGTDQQELLFEVGGPSLVPVRLVGNGMGWCLAGRLDN